MSKIAIVGVEGSGKTVLMAAIGEKYERPDDNGFLLSANSQQTYDVTHNVIDSHLRRGKWPPSTTAAGGVIRLEWTLLRRRNDLSRKICELSFLDYGGEIYRYAFGSYPAEKVGAYIDQINELKRHIRNSDALVVLVNLKDVIIGEGDASRSQEMKWISKSIIDFAAGECGIRRIVLAFTQFETYRTIVESVGGLRGAYRRYLAHIEGPYPSLELVAVSAVDKTALDDEGHEIPAPDFSSSGLDALMEVIAVSAGRENLWRRFRRIFLSGVIVAATVAAIVAGAYGYSRYKATRCDVCDGSGRVDCKVCDEGRVNCSNCDGSGRVSRMKETQCQRCNGTGHVDCPRNGSFKMEGMWYNQLHVYYGKHVQMCSNGCANGIVYGAFGMMPCPKCKGGCIPCETCSGSGKVKCGACDGKRSLMESVRVDCSRCNGSGLASCGVPGCCLGKVKCSACGGSGKSKTNDCCSAGPCE